MASPNPLRKLLASSRILEYVAVDKNSVIQAANDCFARHVASGPVVGELIYKFLTEDDALILQEWVRRGAPQDMVLLNFVSAENHPYTLRSFVEAADDRLHIVGEPDQTGDTRSMEQIVAINNEMATLTREHARRMREVTAAEVKLEKLRAELERVKH